VGINPALSGAKSAINDCLVLISVAPLHPFWLLGTLGGANGAIG